MNRIPFSIVLNEIEQFFSKNLWFINKINLDAFEKEFIIRLEINIPRGEMKEEDLSESIGRYATGLYNAMMQVGLESRDDAYYKLLNEVEKNVLGESYIENPFAKEDESDG